MKVKVMNIDWDTDGESVDLPTEVVVDMDADLELSLEIANAVSDRYGFCINKCDFELVD
jgi:hypothetical protein